MAAASAASFSKEALPDHACSPVFRTRTTCVRCGGLMVGEFCMDLLNSSGELEVETLRCVQCGEVVDPVILANRAIQRVRVPGSSKDHNKVGPQLSRYGANNNCEGRN
jgi:hypothetical protein